MNDILRRGRFYLGYVVEKRGLDERLGHRNRKVMVAMAENVERATRSQLADLVQLLVESVQAKGRTVDPESIVWTPPARPFFEPAALLWRPRTASGTQDPRSVLDYYVGLG